MVTAEDYLGKIRLGVDLPEPDSEGEFTVQSFLAIAEAIDDEFKGKQGGPSAILNGLPPWLGTEKPSLVSNYRRRQAPPLIALPQL